MKRNWLKTILASGLCLSMLVGCSGNSSSSEGSVSVNISSEPPEMLSFLNTDSTSGNVLRHVVEGLVTLNPENEAVPGVAKEVPTKENGGISEDGKTIVFTMNPDAKWSDGTQVTAKDFEFAWDQLFSPTNGAGYASTWAPLIVGAEDYLNTAMNLQEEFVNAGKAKIVKEKNSEGEEEEKFTVEKSYEKEYNETLATRTEENLAKKGWVASEDGTTFTVQLTGPYTYFVNLMAFYNFAPLQQEAYEAAGGLDTYANDMEGFLGNGPFKFKEWSHNDKIVLEKNENYWNADSIKLNEITMRMIDNTNTALNEFENGTIDMIGLTGEQANNLTKDGQKVLNYADGSVWYFEFNHNTKAFSNVKVRKALSLAYDVNTYIDTVKGDQSTVANTFTAPSVNNGEFAKSLGNLFDRPETEADYAELKALLEEGLKEEGIEFKDFKITLLGDTGDDALKTYAFFKEQWQNHLGLSDSQVVIKQVEFKTRIADMQSGNFDIVFAGWSADYDDPMSYLDLWLTGSGNNHGGYSNAEYDKVVKAALVEADAAKRTEYLKQAEKIIAEDYPIGVIYHRQRSYICSDRLTGVVRNAFSDLDLRYAEIK
ncbi:peptide ABC transporter substrate-binding protein [Massilimicrobiota timonensis]|uniref:Peptide ABC transporter substrate-binding protein n=1 Tax=Massilimicrobiota timonensis TaxID=1776392 RepID=A0ABT7UK08_9FIRM|nr:peptide ABC transporter substrate-binding protein [Massilimicrobiota timonensis]MDM8196490.1 peptide ABC transporter substrate-binding protein [Massilimicrobiota timonensis]